MLSPRQLRRTLLPTLCAAALALLSAPHASAAPARTTFDHLTTGFELLGQHRDLPCESCHVNAIFKGTPRDCSACHGVGTAVHATSKPANHILASDRCAACHSAIAWTPATTFDHTEARGSCSSCHNNVQAQGKGATHIDTDLECDACHSTIGWAGAVFNHAGVTSGCASCHNNVNATGKPANHIVTDLPCESCHTSTTTWAGALSMPPNHIPTTAPCQQCHTTASDFSVFSVAGVHQGVTQCLTCHGPSVAGTFNVPIKTLDANHFPIGNLDCNGAGCHSTSNVNPGGFLIGAASITTPTLSVVGHTTIAGAVAACSTCHETAPYLGMVPGGSTASDARPSAALDKTHPTSGDCGGCHTTTPTFALDVTGAGLPANHIPTSAPCAQCHTTAGNYALYSVTGTHQGVTACLSCHGPSVAGTFLNVTITTTPSGHIPIGNLDCASSGCHSASNVNPGGFVIGTASTTSPTLDVNGHASVATAVAACQTCHESAPYLGMLASSATAAGDSRPMAFDKNHPASGDCSSCHTTTPTFALDITAGAKPANHIPTSAPCAQCHTTAGNYALYSVTATHQGVTTCSNCHGPSVANTFANITITTTSASHIPIGSLDCNGGGCHTASNVSPGGFNLGAASISAPTLNTVGHTTVASAVAACQTCHESAPYQGMIASSASTAGDSRPSSALDSAHPTSGDCGGCHLTTPTFASDVVAGTKPANHIPTSAACTQCHQSPGNFAAYSVTGTHQGVTTCVNCHGATVASTFANITITTTSASHIPIGSLDCNGGGCHTASNVSPGGFNIGAASISAPTLNTVGHTTVASAVAACQTCHESAPYQGMIASSASTAGDSRPTALDKNHPTSGDCGSCHSTTPTFATDETASATKPANHIPTSAACTQCHTTAGNYTLYSVTGTHQGVTTCASCHGASVASTFANITITTTPASHIPFGSVDCNGSGCHTAANVNPGGFLIGAANINSPTLNAAGHTTVAGAVSACQTCHESAGYLGMIASTATAGADSRPTAFDKSHPTTGDCGSCHTTAPTFIGNVTAGSKPSNHIPTNAPCAQCHTTAGNYAAYVMGTTGHTGITSGCATCHADGLSFANMAPPTLVEPPTGSTGHVPVGTVACEQCHSITNFTTFAGTVMKHAAVRGNACDSCHEYGMTWKTNTGVQLWTRPSPNHHAGQDCGGSGCHTSRDKHASRPVRALPAAKTLGGGAGGSAAAASAAGTAVVARPALTSGGPNRPGVLGHPSVLGAPCVSCHGPASGMGKPSTHIAASNACQACHTTLAWMPVTRVDHTQVSGTCFSCHNGTLAVGKPATHIASSTACETCHTTNAWTQVRVDHAAVGRSCRNCHDGVHAAGLPVKHIPTRESCDACHGTLSWLPAKLDHSTLTAACATCHNGAIATGMLSSHLRTRLDCASCHTYPDWSVLVFKHTSAAYPGQHRAALDCAACHTSNTDQVPYASAANAGTCAGCHATDFKPAAHPATVKGQSYTAGELANCTGACHVYSDATRTTIVKKLPGPYHRVSDAQFKH